MNVLNFKNFLLEFKRSDKGLILSEKISNMFTIAFEFEIETDDENLQMIPNEEEYLNWIKEKLRLSLNSEDINYDQYRKFIDDVVNLIDMGDQGETFELFEEIEDEDPNKNIILQYLSSITLEAFDLLELEDNENFKGLNYAKYMVEKHMPTFYRKWNKDFNYEFDLSLLRGIEINNKSYIRGINNALEMLKDFFNDFENQDYWKFTHKTSIHINIGLDIQVDWNLFKGVVFLKDWRRNPSDIPFAFHRIPQRIENKFALSIVEIIKKQKLDDKFLNFSDIKYIENDFNEIYKDLIADWGDKTFGFNIIQAIRKNYIEYRHVGGKNLNYDILKEKTLYFCYITYLMVTPDFKRKEYLKKAYKLIDFLKDES